MNRINTTLATRRSNRRGRWLGCGLMLLATLAAHAAPKAGGKVDFARDIRPILSDNCFACHGPDTNKLKADLRLDLKAEAFRKLDSGEFAIVPGKPEQSRLFKLVSLPLEDDDHMPPKKTGKKLTVEQIDLLRRWIAEGAKWAEHWSYVAPQRPAAPEVKHRSWARNDIDRFILARLEQARLKPNEEADPYTLIRRLSLDLTGLPPTLAEVDGFVADKSPDAYERLVERLLASPHFGERLALAWLDQARYADSSGYHFDGFRQMHLWRDWVIRAFNDNMPFDQFTIEQLAGDLLPDATIEQKIATGFHRNVMTTDEGGVDPEEYLAKYQVDRVSTTAQVWLGTTVGCAECHDHKYDPITTREFYQLYAFFNRIPEKGLDGTRTRNPAPVLKVPTPDQGSKLIRYLDLIPPAEKVLNEREAELPKAQEKWEKELRQQEIKEPDLAGLVVEFAFEDSLAPRSRRGNEADSRPSDEARPTTPASTNFSFVPGILGGALQLTGKDDGFIDAGQAVRFEHTNAFSYGAWIKLHGKKGAVLSKMEEGPGYRGFDLLIMEGKVEVHLAHQFPDNAIKVVTKDALATNVWTHVFVTWNGSNKASGVKIYVDGKGRPLETPTDKLSATIATDAPLLIGSRIKAFPFTGLIDDLRFYDRELRSEEVADLYAHAHLLVAKQAANKRTEEQSGDLKKFFREHRASEFLSAKNRLEKLQKEKKDLLDSIPDTMVMDESEKPRETFVLVRGDYQRKGDKVSAGTPACWPPLPKDQPANRLTLARWIASTNNPLTARVTVNRLWAMLFGTGLVKTSNDFGSQGDRPSHPELLDWLACEFIEPVEALKRSSVESGKIPGAFNDLTLKRFNASALQPFNASTLHPWDVKHVLRLLVTSATYRQGAAVSAEKLERDPYNRLLSRGPRVRLDAEIIRDNALAISGLLNVKIGGPSIKPYQPPGIWDGTDQKYEPSKGADLYRRGLYVFWKRAAHYPSFQTFDAPSRETCILQRPRTSTPLQALVVMNDPAYVEAARALAARALKEGGSKPDEQLAYAFRLALARPPGNDELDALRTAYRRHREEFSRDAKAAEALLSVGESSRPKDLGDAELAAMTGVANVLLNLNETITK
jgi:hypothetical protein